MKERKEAKEVYGLRKAKDETRSCRDARDVAAFFDLDGTLLALPSMEQRFFRILRSRKEIPHSNYLLWLKEAVPLARCGFQEMLRTNKAYLHGLQKIEECSEKSSARDPRLPVPVFFREGVRRVEWHVKEGHEVVVMSGTLKPLANEAARSVEAELAALGVTVTIRVCATRLEEKEGRWTGNVLGQPMRGQAKAQEARRLAAEQSWDLSECFAYGDSASDAWLLAAVGKPWAVNPSGALMRIARLQDWPVTRWSEVSHLKKSQSTQSPQKPASMNGKEKQAELENQERHEPDRVKSLGRVARNARTKGAGNEQCGAGEPQED